MIAIMERAIILEQTYLLTDQQYGFQKKRSSETQLLLFVDELISDMASGRQTDCSHVLYNKFDMSLSS